MLLHAFASRVDATAILAAAGATKDRNGHTSGAIGGDPAQVPRLRHALQDRGGRNYITS